MKKMDYTISGAGAKRTITALSDRGKEQTPEPISFENVASAKAFLKTAQAEGFRFSGAELVDPEQKLVKNGYFTVVNGGQLVQSGQDWGPLDTVWEVGDVMPHHGKNTGVEVIVEQIIKGEAAQKMGFGIVFVLRERNISTMN